MTGKLDGAAERKALIGVVLSFDVDWMRNQTSGLARLENGRAEEVAGDAAGGSADAAATPPR